MSLKQLILIDDNKERIQQFENILSFLEYQVSIVNSTDYISILNDVSRVSAFFIGNGCEKQASLIKTVLESTNNLPIILLIDKGTSLHIPTAIQKMVTQSLEWPSHYSVFLDTLKKIPLPKKAVVLSNQKTDNKGLAGNSDGIQFIRESIDQVANSNSTVLVLGESGTGKEVVAQALHAASDRKNKPFVPVNCGAIPAELLESELFGHEKGAFTGALTTRQGRFEMAEGGTLFLDEIGDMPIPMQVKLLRVLQERTFERVGSNNTIECDVRIIAATHRNLEKEIEEKRFREDLFYRLNVFPIELPSLRERVEDIPLLVHYLVTRIEAEKREPVFFTKEALVLMMQHPWPGNVRELSNFIERLTITHPNATLDAVDLPEKFQQYEIPDNIEIEEIEVTSPSLNKNVEDEKVGQVLVEKVSKTSDLPKQGLDLKEYLSDLEVNLIQQALKECNGVVAHAAKLLNMRRTTLVEKLRKYELSV
ncbi:MAG: sigma-54-dependent Fis family transcriptional regulator [Methylococcales bacterium]|nr:sigma-54-dependent Fis family transcriptional regulator [Methylococcales bacterium]